MNLPTFLFLIAAAASPITPGIRDAISSPQATMRELGRDVRATIRRDEEHEQRRSFAPRIAAISEAGPRVESLVTKPTIPAPRITAGFAASHELGQYPSDAAGANSSKYLLHISNASIVAQDRAGVVLSNVRLSSFWHEAAYPDGAVFDSRVLYDSVADRWVFCSLYDLSFHKSTLLIAVSDGANPSLGWHRYRYTMDPSDVRDADFTRMVATRDSFVITANMFTDSGFVDGSDVLTIRKSDAYAGPAALPISQAHTRAYDLVPVDGPEDAQIYFLEGTGNVHLMLYRGIPLETLTDLYPSADNITTFDPVSGSQRGSTLKLDCGTDTLIYNAVSRNGTLWAVTEVARNSPHRASLMWWRVGLNPPPGGPWRIDTGLIDDPTGAAMYGFPSIAVNKFGAALIGYSVFNASIYPSAGYSYVDPSNNLSTPALLKSGDAPSSLSRWADFSTTVVDANDIDFWTNQTYAPVGSAWATWWSKVDMPALPRGRAVHH